MRMTALCFGEILWDFLPDGLFPGGAPFNVAYHLHQQGAATQVVSAVGRDALGDELLRRLRKWKLPVSAISRHEDCATGTVLAQVGAGGDAHYAIAADVAWDRIQLNDETRRAAEAADVLIFGSLAQRAAPNRAVLQELRPLLPGRAWQVFDVNLRPPHDDLALVHELARGCTILKLNTDEAARLSATPTSPAPPGEDAQARHLAQRSGADTVCITAGARGAGLLHRGQWHWEPGRPVTVADTVGAGDSFLATLVTQLHAHPDEPARALARACRMGEWVASRRGGTPTYDDSTPR